jgi:hypothetical protein
MSSRWSLPTYRKNALAQSCESESTILIFFNLQGICSSARITTKGSGGTWDSVRSPTTANVSDQRKRTQPSAPQAQIASDGQSARRMRICLDGQIALTWSPGYTSPMLILFGMRLLEVMFFVGIVGSAVVVLITSFEDMYELFGKSEEFPAAEKTPQQ